MPTRLSDPLLSDAMTRLPGWSGDADGIRGRFVVAAERRRDLLDDIATLAELTGHPIAVEETPDAVDVVLVSEDVHGVTEVDIALATRITDLVSGAATRVIPRQRQAQLNREVTTPAPASDAAYDGDERTWWSHPDTAEPVMGVPATEAGLMPIPLPDIAPQEPEPGIEPEQEPRGGEALGFNLRGAGEAPPPDPE
jgi:4a-hydroxytetrahydrobiopterin dehydratase